MSAAAISYIMMALQNLPMLVQAGVSVAAEVEALTAFVSAGKDPTPAQWADQNTKLATALAALQAASK